MSKFNINEYCDIAYPVFEKFYNQAFPPRATGRKRKNLYKVFFTIIFILRTGCQWRSVKESDELVNGSTANRIFNAANRAGVLEKVYAAISVTYESIIGYDTLWQSVDCTKIQAPVRGISSGNEDTGPNPTDRGFKGSKISVLCDKQGMPMGYCISGANRHDSKLLENTLACGSLFSLFDIDTRRRIMHLCLDKGYDGNQSEECAYLFGYIDHIRTRGEEIIEKTVGRKPKRWVVERLFAWLKGFRYIRTRYTVYSRNFKALVGLTLSTMHVRRLLEVLPGEELVAQMLDFDWADYFNWVEEKRAAAA